MKVLRITLAVLGAVVVLFVVVAVILVRTFDPNDYKDELTAYVQERTGRTLTIEDDIEWSLFPWLAIETGGITLTDDERFGDRSFVAIDEVSARVRVWPLLRRRVELGRVFVDGVNLTLAVDADGVGNWQSLLAVEEPELPPATGSAGDAPRPLIEQLAVEGIVFSNARVLWQDASGEVAYIVSDINLETGEIDDDRPIDVALSLAVLDVASQRSLEIEIETTATRLPELRLDEVTGNLRALDARGNVRADATLAIAELLLTENRSVRGGATEIGASLTEPPVGPETLGVTASFDAVEFDSASGTLQVNGLRTSAAGIDATWQLQGSDFAANPRLTGSVTGRAASLRRVFDALALDWPAAFGNDDAGGADVSASFTASLTPMTVELSRYQITALGLTADGTAALAANREATATIGIGSFAPSQNLLRLVADVVPEGVDLTAITSASANATLAYGLDSEVATISNYQLALNQARVSGNLEITRPAAPTRVVGQIRVTELRDRLVGALFGPWLPPEVLAADIGTFTLDTAFVHNAVAGVTSFEPLALTAYGLSATGQMTIVNENRSGNLTVQGRAEVAQFSPRALLARFDLPAPTSQDPTALTRARLAAGFETNGSNGVFRDIVVDLDDSRITGEFRVDDFADPSYRFVLRADRLDVDRYLPPRADPSATADAADAEAGERRFGDIRIDTEALTATRISGTASVGSLELGGLSLQQLSTGLEVGDGRASLDSVRAQLYGGRFEGGYSVDATGDAAVTHLQGALTDVSIRPLLTALFGEASIGGTGSVTLNLTGRGDTIGDQALTAAGNLSFSLRDGQVDGFNLERTLCAAFNTADRLPAPASAPNLTRYTEMSGAGTVAEGIVTTPSLRASTGSLDITATGRLRPVDLYVNYELRSTLTAPIAIERCDRVNTQVGGSFPWTLEGTLPDVIPVPDLGQYLRERARDELRERAEDRVRDRLEERLRDLL